MNPNNFKTRLLMALLFFVAVLGAIFLGFWFLRKYSSRVYVLNKLIQNVTFENENSLKTKSLLEDNLVVYDSLKSHTISSEDEIPVVIGEFESYAESVNASMKINSISVSAPEKKKPANPEDPAPAAESISIKKLNIDIQASGSFSNLVKLLKLFENSKYIVSIEKYNLRQVLQSNPVTAGGDALFIEITPTTQIQSGQNKIWLVTASLSIPTYIK